MNKKIFIIFALFSFMVFAKENIDYEGFRYLALPANISTNSYKNLAYHSNIDKLHSNKRSGKKILLDFEGRLIYGSAWNKELNLPDVYNFQPWSIDLSPEFNFTEKQRIFNIWRIVGDKFFNYDVTTELLPDWDLNKDGKDDDKYGIRVLVTTTIPKVKIGSLGYQNSFGVKERNTVLILGRNLHDQTKNIADHIIQQLEFAIGARDVK